MTPVFYTIIWHVNWKLNDLYLPGRGGLINENKDNKNLIENTLMLGESIDSALNLYYKFFKGKMKKIKKTK